MNFEDRMLVDGAAQLGLTLSDGQRAAFARYYELLKSRNEAAGITTVIDPEGVQRRHFLESIAVVPALAAWGAPLAAGTRIIDIGSGGGFPGLPIALVVPGLRATLLESHGRRAEFLRAVVRELALSDRVRVVQARAEDAARVPEERESYDLALSRAVASLVVLSELALPFVRAGGALAAIKGSRAANEMTEAAFALAEVGGGRPELVRLPSFGVEGGPVLVVVRKERATPARYPRRAGLPAKQPLRANNR